MEPIRNDPTTPAPTDASAQGLSKTLREDLASLRIERIPVNSGPRRRRKTWVRALLFVGAPVLVLALGIAGFIGYWFVEVTQQTKRIEALWHSSFEKVQQGIVAQAQEVAEKPQRAPGREKPSRMLLTQARSGYEEVLALMERLFPKEAYPNGHEFVPDMLVGHGMACQYLGDHKAAVDSYQRAFNLIEAQYPQDLQHKEFREYLGYSNSNGSNFLGLPPGATITFQVPLVLWDGDNISLVTDGTYLTASGNAPGSKFRVFVWL
jgi:hypothetical protein